MRVCWIGIFLVLALASPVQATSGVALITDDYIVVAVDMLVWRKEAVPTTGHADGGTSMKFQKIFRFGERGLLIHSGAAPEATERYQVSGKSPESQEGPRGFSFLRAVWLFGDSLRRESMTKSGDAEDVFRTCPSLRGAAYDERESIQKNASEFARLIVPCWTESERREAVLTVIGYEPSGHGSAAVSPVGYDLTLDSTVRTADGRKKRRKAQAGSVSEPRDLLASTELGMWTGCDDPKVEPKARFITIGHDRAIYRLVHPWDASLDAPDDLIDLLTDVRRCKENAGLCSEGIARLAPTLSSDGRGGLAYMEKGLVKMKGIANQGALRNCYLRAALEPGFVWNPPDLSTAQTLTCETLGLQMTLTRYAYLSDSAKWMGYYIENRRTLDTRGKLQWAALVVDRDDPTRPTVNSIVELPSESSASVRGPLQLCPSDIPAQPADQPK